MITLTVNIGSSSIKAAVFDVVGAASLDMPAASIWASETSAAGESPDELLPRLLSPIWDGPGAVVEGPGSIETVAHRVVHGGQDLTQPTILDATVRDVIRAHTDLAPSHNPLNLAGIEIAGVIFPDARQVAVFDTGFHSTLPPAAFTLSGPKDWASQGIRRYGFHGISHEYVTRRAVRLLGLPVEGLRIVSCHLGSGCSLAAVANGNSVDTTMGFTPLDGLVMGSRSGSVDPGVLLHLLRTGTTLDDLDRILNRGSGLLGLSGISGDMRAVRLAAEGGDSSARLALDVFVHRLRGQIASMAASMNGIDALVFTAGIGEHDAQTRAATADGLGFLGVKIDIERNRLVAAAVDMEISAPGSPVRTLVVHTNENWAIACAAVNLVRSAEGPPL